MVRENFCFGVKKNNLSNQNEKNYARVFPFLGTAISSFLVPKSGGTPIESLERGA
ncbi:hypothetical protein HMPREF1988_00656 [Porphyromonas gingivalis F0185]|uniref:Uncharacterized protein n=1 Tax=Porphyromonas gingivalis F0570 TaxID=1227271 RepID=A0A0E2LQR1_PORGN|nr:hypothetical protein HMPREF1555_01070 [Porphyromonas gingivalis F0570]ERJ68800.1 hypothetical protein HMPREF1553_00887 [Porphyromonas gingivalis F0568]ERJ84647.1 hypothetical protein HMPREF1988_00656 [Porphyromonas gingivalis F0185]ERJ86522.1 hypothetical protein HMPREF1989_01178 [Porphyromonas gingivalis F0566]